LTGLRLPPEICWSIIEWVTDDKTALGNFSLVCKDWMHVTRKKLFATVVFRQSGTAHRLLLEEMIESPFCSIFPYVKTLGIVSCLFLGSKSTEEALVKGDLIPTWMDKLLSHIPKFTELTALSLVQRLYLGPKALGMVHIARFVSELTQLQTLIFCEGPSNWWPLVTEYFSPGTTLKEAFAAPPLSINSVFMMYPPGPGRSGSTAQGDATGPKILKWLTNLPRSGATGIHTWFGVGIPIHFPTEFRDFADHFQITLTRFSFSVFPWEAPDATSRVLDLQQLLTNLKHVQLNIEFDAFPCIPNIVAKLPQSLETICLAVGDDPDESTVWAHLDRVLAETAFPFLRVFEVLWLRGFHLDNTDGRHWGITHAELCQYLPRCSVEKNFQLRSTNLDTLNVEGALADRRLEYFPYF
ncbi:hypothetical protein R3P38DRAFT_2507886, partial [Favolaschia claudopus]